MTKKEAVEVILAARRGAYRVGHDFIVDRDRLGALGGFTVADVDKILAAVLLIEKHRDEILARV